MKVMKDWLHIILTVALAFITIEVKASYVLQIGTYDSGQCPTLGRSFDQEINKDL